MNLLVINVTKSNETINTVPYDLVCTECLERFDEELSPGHFDKHDCALKRRGYYQKTKKCKLCDKLFSTHTKFKKHASMCHPFVRYGCKVCEKTFSKMNFLRDHHNEHADINPHICKICGSGFYSSSKLSSHQRFSHDEFKLRCPDCDLSFATSQMLGNHQRTVHLKARSLKCLECGKGFSNSSCLYQHRTTHKIVKAFECEMCDEKFSRGFTLKRHMERIHNGD